MTIAQCKASRVRGRNYRKLNGPGPVNAHKSAMRLRRKEEKAKDMASRRASKK